MISLFQSASYVSCSSSSIALTQSFDHVVWRVHGEFDEVLRKCCCNQNSGQNGYFLPTEGPAERF